MEDSREKLEADVRMRSIRPSTYLDCTYDDVMRWLDRQVAITKSEMQSQVRQLEGDLKGARTSRDHWRDVASRHAAKIQRLRKQLKDAEKYGAVWPTFEDGAFVKFNDEFMWGDEVCKVDEFRFQPGFTGVRGGSKCAYSPLKRPPLRGADGQPIEIGQTLYGEDGKAWEVRCIHHGEKYAVLGFAEGQTKPLKAEWLTHEKPKDSLEEVVRTLRCCPSLDGEQVVQLADRIERLAKGE